MSFVRRFGTPVLGLVIALIGIAIYGESLQIPRGYSAYAPLTHTTFVPSTPPGSAIGVIAILLGVVLAAGFLGYRAGLQHPSTEPARRFWTLVAGVLVLIVFVLDALYATQTYAGISGDVFVGTPDSYRETALSLLTGSELGGAIRVALLAVALAFISAWIGGTIGRRRSLVVG